MGGPSGRRQETEGSQQKTLDERLLGQTNLAKVEAHRGGCEDV